MEQGSPVYVIFQDFQLCTYVGINVFVYKNMYDRNALQTELDNVPVPRWTTKLANSAAFALNPNHNEFCSIYKYFK